VFSKPESAAISDRYTAVQLVGGVDLDDEGRAFMRRYGVRGFPTLLAMTADGAVLGRGFQRTVEGLLSGLARAEAANKTFLEEQPVLAKKDDADSVRRLAGLYKQRAQHEQARAGFEKLTATGAPEVEDQVALLDVYAALAATDARNALLQKLVDTRQQDERHIRWRMDLATAHLPRITSRELRIEVLPKRKVAFAKLLEDVEKPADQAVLRFALAGVLARTGDPAAALVHWDWILEHVPESSDVPKVLMRKAQAVWSTSNNDPARLEAARALLQRVIDEYASTPEARLAGRSIKTLEKKIAESSKKAEDAKKSEEEKDADGGPGK